MARGELTSAVVPHPVSEPINIIKSKGLHVEGLFRIPNLVLTNQWMASYDGGYTNVIMHENCKGPNEIHAAAGILKNYVRLLPESLFQARLYNMFLETGWFYFKRWFSIDS